MCLNSPTLPFLPCFITFCSTHSYTSYFYEIFATCIIYLSAANSKDQYNLQFHAFSYSLTSWTIHVLPFRTHVIAQSYYTSIDAKCIPLHVCSLAYLVRKRGRLGRSPSLLCEVKVNAHVTNNTVAGNLYSSRNTYVHVIKLRRCEVQSFLFEMAQVSS